jgi:hypothetical protein
MHSVSVFHWLVEARSEDSLAKQIDLANSLEDPNPGIQVVES